MSPHPAVHDAGDGARLTALQARLAEQQARGLERHDPLRWHYLHALARHTLAQQGPVRALLLARLERALDETPICRPSAGFTGAPPGMSSPASAAAAPASPLAELVQGLNRGRAGDAARADGAAAAPELQALRRYRSTWERLSVRQRLVQALAQGSDNAGPINSHRLVLQSLALMQEVSPGYLQRFLPYVETLLALDTPTAPRPRPKAARAKAASAPRGPGPIPSRPRAASASV